MFPSVLDVLCIAVSELLLSWGIFLFLDESYNMIRSDHITQYMYLGIQNSGRISRVTALLCAFRKGSGECGDDCFVGRGRGDSGKLDAFGGESGEVSDGW